ncbi:MAG TPA: PAS domain S-box protein [Thermoleophilaceae bacterium]|nr:PAS domain S-box protein [Thermoleophilaceae bacterium]
MFPSPAPSSDALFKVLYDSPVALGMTDARSGEPGKYVIVNTALCALLGYSEEELRERDPIDITHPDDVEITRDLRKQLFRGEISSYDVEKRFLTKDGEARAVRLYVSLIRDDDGAPLLSVGRMIDLTELKKLLASQAAMIGGALDAIIGMDGDGLVTEFNPTAERIFGYSKEVVVGRPLADLIVPPRSREAHMRGFRRVVAGGESRMLDEHTELPAMRVDGSEFPVELTITRTQDDPPLFTGFVRDLTERHDAEQALAESERRYRRIVETTSEGIWMLDADHRTSFVNPRMAEILGHRPQDMLGKHPFEFAAEDADVDVSREALDRRREGVREAYQHKMRHRNGREVHAWMSASPLFEEDGSYGGSLAMVTDVTDFVNAESERADLQMQLHQSQRLETVGKLAGGVAHDFNNLLAVILNYADYLKDEVADNQDAAEGLEEIRRAAERGAALTGRLLAFSRRDSGRPEVVELPRVVGDVRRLLERTMGKTVELEIETEDDLPAVTADVHQLEQVILNLAINARDAMPEGGRLQIELSQLELDDAEARRRTDAKPGRYALIKVTDTGVGMEPEVAQHAFDPFFTTKPAGEGTGLGLAMVYGIVTSAGGHVTLDSRPYEGTTLAVHLPAAEVAAPVREDDAIPVPPVARGQKILVVDDEDAVRRITARILSRHGYEVVEAAGGEEALRIYHAMEERPALVLTDVAMPRVSGVELAGKLNGDSGPPPPVIFMSGYSGRQAPDPAALQSAAGFLQKPFGASALLSEVGHVLAGSAQAPV